jgi:diamine N-acetyltransferase
MCLRVARGADVEAVLPLIEGEGAWYFGLRGEPVPSAEALRNRFRGRCPSPGERHFVLEGPGREPLGLASVWHVDWRGRKADVGLLLPDGGIEREAEWAEGVRRFVRYLFDEENLARLWSEVPTFVRRSWHYLQGAGFTSEGILREQLLWGGQYRDVGVLALLRDGVGAAVRLAEPT